MRLTIILSSKLTLSSACQFAVKIEREPGIRTLKAELKVLWPSAILQLSHLLECVIDVQTQE